MATRGRPPKQKPEVVSEEVATQEEVVTQPQAEEVVAPEAQEAEVVKKKPAKKEEQSESDNVIYETSGDETTSFDVLLKGQYIRANWNADRTRFHFVVPANLAERMDAHHHVVTGRIKRRD